MVGCLNSRATVTKLGQEEVIVGGDPTERALLQFFRQTEDLPQLRAKYPKIFEVPFNSKNKWQISMHSSTIQGSRSTPLILVMKGATERVMSRCSTMMIQGEQRPFTPELRQEAEDGRIVLLSVC
jgi:sodium/potassium-transporting ATPase subunit alpha